MDVYDGWMDGWIECVSECVCVCVRDERECA